VEEGKKKDVLLLGVWLFPEETMTCRRCNRDCCAVSLKEAACGDQYMRLPEKLLERCTSLSGLLMNMLWVSEQLLALCSSALCDRVMIEAFP